MRTFWIYTGARLLILLAVGGLLYLAGARGLLLVVLAFFVSMLISYLMLSGMRERLAAGVQARAERINERIEASARAEDDGVDDAEGPAGVADGDADTEIQPGPGRDSA